MSVVRYDSIGRLSKADKTAQGFYRVKARFTRAGVLQYNRGNVVNELRPPEEVFDSRSLATARAGLPVTVGHIGQISPANVAAKVGQSVTDAVREGQYLTCMVQIEDAGTIARIDAGELCELSAGYIVREHAAERGSYNGMQYDSVQRGITYNHIALLRPGEGRAGPDVRLHLDSAADVGYATGMGSITLEGVTYDVPEPVAAAWERMCAMCEQYQAEQMAEQAAETAVAAVTQAAVAAVQAAPDPASAPVADSGAPVDSTEGIIAERIAVLDAARTVVPGLKFTGQSVRQLQEAVLAARGIRCDSKADAWIAGAFEMALAAPAAQTTDSKGPAAVAKPTVSTVVIDAADAAPIVPTKTPAQVREEAIAARANAWKVAR